MSYNNREVFYFDCDQRGKNTRCKCGARNSSGGYERPFIILSNDSWNKKEDYDGMYVLPLTTSGEGGVHSHTLREDNFEDKKQAEGFNGSIILCDKICRVSKKEKSGPRTQKAKLDTKTYEIIKNKIDKFMEENLFTE